ncbi:hypothetical protein [Geofilum rubicundum]|uniref:Uncharacterized protein n=1 Tax=Geofilum rubicundum JCM 15548 TaxID=1236989 RepID=A0A0E9LVF9_9BACT|nr:hypothetical protein [Geofilum rubicundum]GAO29101.1 hypothetical protein JCM15548_11258 [Geofilum rubicundum JCM 15548]
MANEFRFKYKLSETGKVKGYFELNNKNLPFEVTNASNPLGDLLKAMVSFVQEPAHLWGEINATAVEWYGDDCIFVLEFSSDDGKTLQLSITRNSAPFGEQVPGMAITGTLELEQFYLTIIKELDGMIKYLGLLNYAQMWQNDEFPLTYFLLLKKYLIEWKRWTPSLEESDVLESEFMMVLS